MSAALFSSGEVGENLAKGRGIIAAEIRRHLNARDHDFHGRVFRFHTIDNGLEIGFHLRNRQSAQSVICAEGENEDVDLFLQHPIEPRQAARGCVAAHPGVDHVEGQILLPDLLLDERRVGLLLLHAKPGGQAVAEKQDRSTKSRRRKNERGKRENKNPTRQFPHARRITIA